MSPTHPVCDGDLVDRGSADDVSSALAYLTPVMDSKMTMFARTHRSVRLALLIPLVWLAGCRPRENRPLFELLSERQTGIAFANTITTDDSVNVQSDVYVYNGAGVAIGDIDNDGLPDLFFAGNMVTSRLYRNTGKMRFEDITQPAGLVTKRWITGVTMVDINHDGFLDIYASVSGHPWSTPAERANLLFINNRDRTFTESAARYGIADTNFTTHSAFLDYDGDGCLDLFVLNNSPEDFARGDVATHPSGARGETPGSRNVLYRNGCRGTFTNVSRQAGILEDAGYGLGVSVADVNLDGRPDIYVSNDAAPNDVLYVNNGNGTFTDKAARWLKHTSLAGMGVDIADFNNDGRPDILQVDMMPPDMSRRKRMSGFTTHGSRLASRSRGFRDDFDVNSLQLNTGVTPNGELVFSDIARLAGVAATDWSWSALFADFDNDGLKDIFIGNGYPKAVNDLDYQGAANSARRAGEKQRARQLLKDVYAYDAPNHVFRNNGDLTFTDKTKAWGMDRPSFSYGAAYGDLDNDGKLDVVVNNINGPAFIYRNIQPSDDAHHHLRIRLVGDSSNTRGIGTTLVLRSGGTRQHVYHAPVRGFMSSMDDAVHFGLGRARRVDSLEVTWPDGRVQVLTNLEVDRLIVVKQSDATRRVRAPATPARALVFEALDARKTLSYRQLPTSLADYTVQPLLPYNLSSHGPPLAVGDVNGDRLDDVYIGGTAGVAGQLFIQQQDGRFVASVAGQPWEGDKAHEDWGALFFDATGDGRPDLYVASGGYHLSPTSPLLQDRLYVNTGGGRFARSPTGTLPVMLTSTATVRVGNLNGDARPDLFIGGRLSPRDYPAPTRSYLLRNDGDRFTDVTAEVAPELARAGGMITDAAWIDFDGDGRQDLVTVGEWMPIRFYRNDGTQLRDVTQSMHLPPTRGWWYSLAVGDFDRDGRPDLVAGNLGLNHAYHTSMESRFGVYAAAFTGNRSADIVLTQELGGVEYPYAGLASLGREIYSLGVKFPTFGSFAKASVTEAFGATAVQGALHYQTDTFASVFLHNEGGRGFTSVALPNLAQIAPIKSIVAHDVDGDGHLDLVLAGNMFDVEPNTPRADAGNGLWMRGDGAGHFSPVSPTESGLLAPLDVSGLAMIRTATGNALLVANTGDSLQAFSIRARQHGTGATAPVP